MDRFEITGSEGKVVLDPLDSGALVVYRGKERENDSLPLPSNPQVPLIEDFVEAVTSGRRPLSDGESGLRTQRILEATLAEEVPVP
jgi:predicted dehydrogenase